MTNGCVAARPGLVERPRRQLFASAGLARDQHHLRVGREPLNQAEHLLHRRAAAQHAAEFELSRHLALERDDARAALQLVADIDQYLLQAIEVERLRQYSRAPSLMRFDGAVDGGASRSSG